MHVLNWTLYKLYISFVCYLLTSRIIYIWKFILNLNLKCDDVQEYWNEFKNKLNAVEDTIVTVVYLWQRTSILPSMPSHPSIPIHPSKHLLNPSHLCITHFTNTVFTNNGMHGNTLHAPFFPNFNGSCSNFTQY